MADILKTMRAEIDEGVAKFYAPTTRTRPMRNCANARCQCAPSATRKAAGFPMQKSSRRKPKRRQ